MVTTTTALAPFAVDFHPLHAAAAFPGLRTHLAAQDESEAAMVLLKQQSAQKKHSKWAIEATSVGHQ